MKEGTPYSRYRHKYKVKRILSDDKIVGNTLLPYPAYMPKETLDFKTKKVLLFIKGEKLSIV